MPRHDDHALTLLEPIIAARFDTFGCVERGMHLDAAAEARCRPCAVWAGDTSHGEVVRLSDDRGGARGIGTNRRVSWDHQRWVKPGVGLHRADGPAVEGGGVRAWCRDGFLSREDGPALEWPGGEAWFLNGRLHRSDGPASTNDMARGWYVNGVRHRADGPAVVVQGSFSRWYLDGQQATREHAWRHWVADAGIISPDNTAAIEFLGVNAYDTVGDDLTFPHLDTAAMMLAEALHRNHRDPAAGCGISHERAKDDEPVALATSDDPLWPARFPASGAALADVRYDVPAVRRRLAQASAHGMLVPRRGCAPSVWNPANRAPYVEAEICLDPALYALGVPGRLVYSRAAQERVARSAGTTVAIRGTHDHIDYFVALHEHAHALATALAVNPSAVDLGIDLSAERLTAVIEAAYVRAAQWIAVGIDDALARSWASAAVMAAGGPCVPMTPDAGAADASPLEAWPAPHRGHDFYHYSLDDVRQRGDATRFMTFVSMCFMWPRPPS